MSRLERLGRWCAANGLVVVLLWANLLLLTVGGLAALGRETSDDFSVPGAESQQAFDLLTERFPDRAGVEGKLVVAVDTGTLADPARVRALDAAAARLAALPDVKDVATPAQPQGGGRLTEDGRTGVVAFVLDKTPGEVEPLDVEELLEAAAPARLAGIQTEVGGAVAVAADQPKTGAAELVGVGAAVLILLLAFGSAVAMALPLVMALAALGIGLATLGMLGRLVDIPGVAPSLATMIGLGVGIDYALFVVTRHRAHLAAGMDVPTAVGRAVATSGAAVLFAGVTVMIAICGLAIAGIPLVAALGYATSFVVALAVLAALTLLPALLGLLGPRVDRLQVPFMTRARHEHQGAWHAWSQRIARHPWGWATASVVLLTALAAPALSLQLGQPDSGNASPQTTERRAYDLLADGFGPGTNGPLLLAVQLDTPVDAGSAKAPPGPAADPRLARLVAGLEDVDGVAAVTPPAVGPDLRTAVLTVVPTTSPQDPRTERLIQDLRNRVLPQLAQPGVQVLVGGQTATFIDLSARVADRLPWFVGAVVLLSCLLLVLVFRSAVLPLQAAVMNVLSIGAALGVVVSVFQHGFALALVGLDEPVPIISFVPLMMFAILFGLSMDYQVFLLSSVREVWVEEDDNTRAVTLGLARTGRVITSAALIMMAVFGSFVLSDDPLLKVFGLGLTVAVLLDATVIRCVLVPAVMVLCGRANWWLPRRLDAALPRLDVEPPRPALRAVP